MPRPEDDRLHWRRVSPVAMIYFALKMLPALGQMWPALIPLFAGGEEIRQIFWVWGIPAALLLLSMGVVLYWWFFSFAIEDNRLTLRSGVFNRKRLSLDFERVQQADIADPFYFRPFKLVTLGLESAGSAQQEVDVPGIPVALAESLRHTILEKQVQTKPATETEVHAATSAADYRLSLGPAEIARYGLMHNTLLYLAPLAAPFGQHLGPLFESWLVSLESSQVYSAFNWLSANLAVSVTLVLAVFAVLVGTSVLFGLSVLLAFVRYWGYTLTRVDDRYQSRAGLTTVRTRGFKIHKLQKVTLVQGVIAKLLKRYTVSISKAGGIAGQSPQAQDKNFTVPVLDELNWLLLRGELKLPKPEWTRVHPFSWRFPCAICSLIIVLSALAASFKLGAVAFTGLLGLVPLLLIGRRLWRQKGYFYNGEWLAWRRGFIGFSEQWLPVGKLQKIQLAQSPLKRLVGLCDLQVWSADGRVTLVCLPKGEAQRLRDGLLTGVVMYKKPWF
ncbi:PH domain-containing protein [Gilvimarinus xylanilyticus]|uniref:PH domain-containing protein n=1 Tax=Gilvimarinus xylanilyticus TaxID=2944139 RepID=A0A9X2HXD0_9GAMM|nr:PH domain-containing protein [Gilvimarinus xylanilyticus]MCP8898306.1 PH domain-containing protein [Gilvimarinus xylanilyticus]